MEPAQLHPSSFRDPSGHVFSRDSVIYRQVNQLYKPHYEMLLSSGLLSALQGEGLLIDHDEVSLDLALNDHAYRVIQPEPVPFVSYPYEWCFDQLKEAALLTLKVQEVALAHNMTLVDASAFNVQFIGTSPVFIDTLSFRPYEEGVPWTGYKQFCQHFLAPLALMSYLTGSIARLQQSFIDGIPLDLADRLLPLKSRTNVALLAHISANARAIRSFSSGTTGKPAKSYKVSKMGLTGILESLGSTVKGLKAPQRAEKASWLNYREFHNYSDEDMDAKSRLVADFLGPESIELVWDLGANTGEFSRLAAAGASTVVSADMDHDCVNRNYRDCKQTGAENVLPLVVDLSCPTPAIGWFNRERQSFMGRGPADAVIALALVHHLAIGNNLPFRMIAEWFASCGSKLIIEFVPGEDSQVKQMLSSREDIFGWYTMENFEAAFGDSFEIEKKEPIGASGRTLYLMQRAG